MGVDGCPYLRDAGRRHEVQHHLIGVLCGDPHHGRSERAHRDSGLRLRTTQPEAVAAHVPAAVVDAGPGQYRPEALDGFAHDSRMVCPVAVMPAGHDRRTGGTERNVHPAARQGGDRGCAQRQRHRAADTNGQRADPQSQSRCAVPDRGGQRERVVGGHFADPHRAEPCGTCRQRHPQCLLVGSVQPERQGDFDTSGHSIDTSAGWSSRMRPGSSRDASLTWKCAVAVKASRNRRCSDAPS